MKLAIMQPYAFPYIGYFQLINVVDKFILLDDVNYIMRGWINRNVILVNGKDFLFSIPLKKASQNKLIFECEIKESNWKEKLQKTIEFSYKKAPFYSDCFEVISTILSSTENNLSKWLSFQINVICNYLDINTEIVESSRLYNTQNLKAQDKIMDICIQEGADTYYNAIGGKNFYDKNDFNNKNIELHFLRTQPVTYMQFSSDFKPLLSIIDVMMFNSSSTINNMLKQYEII
jgi:predicted methyltransferase